MNKKKTIDLYCSTDPCFISILVVTRRTTLYKRLFIKIFIINEIWFLCCSKRQFLLRQPIVNIFVNRQPIRFLAEWKNLSYYFNYTNFILGKGTKINKINGILLFYCRVDDDSSLRLKSPRELMTSTILYTFLTFILFKIIKSDKMCVKTRKHCCIIFRQRLGH